MPAASALCKELLVLLRAERGCCLAFVRDLRPNVTAWLLASVYPS